MAGSPTNTNTINDNGTIIINTDDDSTMNGDEAMNKNNIIDMWE